MSAPIDGGRFDRPRIRDVVFRLAEWEADSEGSSRSSALIRIGLAALFWARLANDMILYRDQSAVGLLLSLSFFISTSALMVGFHSRTAALWAGIIGFTVYYFGQDLGRPPCRSTRSAPRWWCCISPISTRTTYTGSSTGYGAEAAPATRQVCSRRAGFHPRCRRNPGTMRQTTSAM